MHSWGDETVDWKGINDAARYIGTQLVRWGRVPVRDWKEKYGTVRVYTGFGWESLYSITHPRYVYYRGPQWIWKYVHCSKWSRWIFRHLVNPIVVPYHVWLYKLVYRRAIRKWPHLRLEILDGADYLELLEEHGIHRVRTSENSYSIYYDWHPDNYVSTKEEEKDVY